MITNFPNQGDDKKISIANSKYPQFDYSFAKRIKEEYSELWNKYATGGKGEDKTSFTGGDAFNAWTKYRQDGGQEEWIKRRERYFDRFANADNSIANAIGHIKWGGYTSNFKESEIKRVINEEIKEKEISKSFYIPIHLQDIKGIFTGYASHFNGIDKVGDTVRPNAFDQSIRDWREGKSIFINKDHSGPVIADNVDLLETDEKGLKTKFKFKEEAKSISLRQYGYMTDETLFSWAVREAKQGRLALSIGGTATIIKGSNVNIITKFKLKHIAITTMPVDTQATIEEVKSFNVPKYPVELANTWDSVIAEKNWRDYSNSNEKPSAMYKNGFLYIEDDKKEQFGGYHFLVVDVIDGEPVVNQQAVITAYRYLEGARRGVKILDEAGKTKAKASIKKLYEKINRARSQEGIEPLPVESIKSQIGNIDGRVSFEKFLKANTDFSNSEIEEIVSKAQELFTPQGSEATDQEVSREGDKDPFVELGLI